MIACCVVFSTSCGKNIHLAQKKTSQRSQLLDKNFTLEKCSNLEKTSPSKTLEIFNKEEQAEQQLIMNYCYEMKRDNESPNQEKRTQIQRKYELLREIFLKEKVEKNNKFFPELDKSFQYEQKDVPYRAPDYNSVYHPKVLEQVLRVFNDFGDLYINETKDLDGKISSKEVQVKRPWAGYWFPFSSAEEDLYLDETKPLGKFEAVLKKMGHDPNIRSFEKNRYKGYHPDSWEGLCDAWSLSSILTPEPSCPREIAGVYFSISDLKSLLTFSHLKYPKRRYGISYRGDAETDGTYQDIKPEAFHRIITQVLGKEKRPVVVDYMAGIQVWNKPLYRYRWKISKDPEVPNAFLVNSYPWLVKERNQQGESLTTNADSIAPIYKYRLYVDKKTKHKGKYKVIAGQWLGDSFFNHPDSVAYAEPQGQLGSHNPEFNKYLDIYKELFIGS